MSGNLETRETAEGVEITVFVQPRAATTALVGIHGGVLKVRVAAPPVKGRATEECLRFLAKMVGVRRSDVELMAGMTSRIKRVRFRGVSRERLLESLFARGDR
ncbi:MAG TPA: DUF167 domain-containing protein [Blastocatellia bacterium]|nr:DUF167 domain-containing protein [Blastocatellia bacterium]